MTIINFFDGEPAKEATSVVCPEGVRHDFHRRPKQDDILRNLKVWVCINCGGVHYDKVEVPVEVVDADA